MGVFSWYTEYMTVIMGNLKKDSVRIDPQGNVINPRTKEFIRPMEEPYKLDPEDFKRMEEKRNAEANGTVAETPQISTDTAAPKQGEESPLAAIIKAQVNKAVQEQIKSIDIGKMVADAIKESFK